MTSILLALLPAITVPRIGVDEARYVNSMMPYSMDREGHWIAANVELWVNDAGRVQSCEVISFVGEPSLAERICPILIDRRVGKGTAADRSVRAARLRTRIVAFPDRAMAKMPAMIERLEQANGPFLVDTTLPAPEEERVTIKLELGADGVVLACERSSRKAEKELVEAACKAAAETRHPIYLTAEGVAARYVSMFTVQFAQPD